MGKPILTIGDAIFFIDKDFTNVIFLMEAEEYNQMQEAISHIKELLEEANK